MSTSALHLVATRRYALAPDVSPGFAAPPPQGRVPKGRQVVAARTMLATSNADGNVRSINVDDRRQVGLVHAVLSGLGVWVGALSMDSRPWLSPVIPSGLACRRVATRRYALAPDVSPGIVASPPNDRVPKGRQVVAARTMLATSNADGNVGAIDVDDRRQVGPSHAVPSGLGVWVGALSMDLRPWLLPAVPSGLMRGITEGPV